MFDVILLLAILVEGLLPLVRFAPRLGSVDTVVFVAWIVIGYVVLRSAHSAAVGALRGVLSSRWSTWTPTLVGTLGVLLVAAQGAWRGPAHWAVVPTGVIALLGPVVIRLAAGAPEAMSWRRGAALAACGLGYVVIVFGVTLNVTCVFPRYSSPVGANMAAAWVFGVLAIARPWSMRTALSSLGASAVLGGVLFVVVPDASTRTAGFARRQTELAGAAHPVSWSRGLSPLVYLSTNVQPPQGGAEHHVELAGVARKRPVVLLTIDTLREDLYLPTGTTLREQYPNIAKLIGDGCRYSDARTVSAYTHLSMPALYNGTAAFDRIRTPLMRMLADQAGLRPRAFGRLMNMGVYTGFPHELGGDTDSSMVELALTELERDIRSGQPAFYAMHFLDVHLPKKLDISIADWAEMRSLYAGRVREVDALIGRVLALLERSGWYDDALIVLTSDHGEELGERGYFEHAFHLYDTVMKVPFIVKDSADDCGDQSAPVSVLDVPARIAQGLGLRLEGPTLESTWPPRGGRTRFAVSTLSGPYAAWVEGSEKVIVDLRYGDVERYDLKSDPGERFDLGRATNTDVEGTLARQNTSWNPHIPRPARVITVSGASR